MKMSKALIFTTVSALIISATSAYAAVQECTSTDPDHALKVTLDQDNNTITVNDEKTSLHKPAPGASADVMLVSDPYDTEHYGQVYISVSHNKDGKVVISQVGVKDKETKASYTLDCNNAKRG